METIVIFLLRVCGLYETYHIFFNSVCSSRFLLANFGNDERQVRDAPRG